MTICEPFIYLYWYQKNVTVDVSREKWVVQSSIILIEINLLWIMTGYKNLYLNINDESSIIKSKPWTWEDKDDSD